MSEETATIDTTNQPVTVQSEKTVNNTETVKPSPAQDLRDIQMLIVSGIFPGNVAPQVIKAYKLLEDMALKVEADAQSQK